MRSTEGATSSSSSKVKRRSAGLYLVALVGGELVAKPTPTRSQSTNRETRGSHSSAVGRSDDPSGLIWSPWPAGSEWRNRRLFFLILLFILQGEKLCAFPRSSPSPLSPPSPPSAPPPPPSPS